MSDVFTSTQAFPTNILDQRISDSQVLPPQVELLQNYRMSCCTCKRLGFLKDGPKRKQKECTKGITVIQEQSIVKNLAQCTGHFPKHTTHTHACTSRNKTYFRTLRVT